MAQARTRPVVRAWRRLAAPLRTLVLVTLVVAVVAVVLVVRDRQIARQSAVPTATPTTTPGTCPSSYPLPPDARSSAIDTVPSVVWRGAQYAATGGDPPSGLGEFVFAVTCSIPVDTPGFGITQPWHDGTAEHLPVGTKVHRLPGHSDDCVLVATQPLNGEVVILKPLTPVAGC